MSRSTSQPTVSWHITNTCICKTNHSLNKRRMECCKAWHLHIYVTITGEKITWYFVKIVRFRITIESAHAAGTWRLCFNPWAVPNQSVKVVLLLVFFLILVLQCFTRTNPHYPHMDEDLNHTWIQKCTTQISDIVLCRFYQWLRSLCKMYTLHLYHKKNITH